MTKDQLLVYTPWFAIAKNNGLTSNLPKKIATKLPICVDKKRYDSGEKLVAKILQNWQLKDCNEQI